MRTLLFLLTIVILTVFFSCSKSNSSPKPPGGDSTSTGSGGNNGGSGTTATGNWAFSNSEYVGTMIPLSREWPKPILVHFNTDSTVWDYCFFQFTVNNVAFNGDSILGKIVKVGTGSTGGPELTIYFRDIADTQVYDFSSDLSAINGLSKSYTGGSLGPNQFYFTNLKKSSLSTPSIASSYWTTDTSKANDGTKGMAYYPDICGISFLPNGTTWYNRNNATVTYGQLMPDSIITIMYRQSNSRVYFYGYDELTRFAYAYFGVLLTDGQTMIADTRDFSGTRVPYYGQTAFPFGIPGNTPTLHKHKS